MADASEIQNLVDYYTNLLIIQYRRKAKARAHIGALADMMMASGVYFDVLNGFDIETAVGKQLDILGKYAGVDRFFLQTDLENFFGFTDYDEVNPDAQPKFGFSTYSNFNSYQYNGTLTYDDLIKQKNTLSDDDFRTLIKVAIIQNTSDHAWGTIDDEMFKIFGNTVWMESPRRMVMFYFVVGAITPLIQAMITKHIFPAPMGVGVGVVSVTSTGVFAFADYSGTLPPNGHGFSTYADFATSSGQILTYDVMQQG